MKGGNQREKMKGGFRELFSKILTDEKGGKK